MDSRDEKRGTLPVILSNDETITFIIKIALGPTSAYELVIRCDRNGEIFASVQR